MVRRIAIVAGLVLGLQLLICPTYAASLLQIDETEFNFGYVPQHAKISHVFWLKAAGEDSLKIIKVLPG
ncbi:MAG: hypothetical protein DRP45_06655 [Candidatus Zixiibacteriota bacterium]|nr:MAG: hypothetical protein DRP45_06655 [candidate division Zixibacteria bacterium]